MDHEKEFKQLLSVARQAIGSVDFKNRSTPFAPLRALKNAVDHYDSICAAEDIEREFDSYAKGGR
jgi:hypothetical protein